MESERKICNLTVCCFGMKTFFKFELMITMLIHTNLSILEKERNRLHIQNKVIIYKPVYTIAEGSFDLDFLLS